MGCRLRALVVLFLAAGLSSCIVTGSLVTHHFHVAGGSDHLAHVSAAWRGPAGELALALEDLEAAYSRRDTVLVLTASELEQMFAAVPMLRAGLLPVPHVPMPRAVLARELTLERPPAGSELFVPAAEWDSRRETDGERHHALPEELPDTSWSVHWTHHYVTGVGVETGFALLLTRKTEGGVQHALLMPEPFDPPLWLNAIAALAVLLDVTWMTLVLAG
jgi:hypothetical protein